jgi:hypothetical protein
MGLKQRRPQLLEVGGQGIGALRGEGFWVVVFE